ncbi:MAG TPA: bifunctional diaminohydroxyphosphoribosylaminopyrimidine deaminase/5-amino-6-(5-phosphoribosylamino)uracil reductase RibD [Polyangiaceae bacterium]|nr:bifunctional diaminohydroxyphosphoribosylaminopyrimidine deaminase/5-amino-6-(5-phosphoribosylamino)uracil reductase RibD [Polyangiaceae bacterium]
MNTPPSVARTKPAWVWGETARRADARHDRFMARAIGLAQRGRPAPNPHVGAVVVRDNRVVGIGHHELAGGPHAEVVALRNASWLARGATLYVTLEPCNHFGRTPPCVEAILQAGIARVVIGCSDPNPRVKGGGAQRLRAAGVVVIEGVQQPEALRLIQPWLATLNFASRPPYSALASHSTLDAPSEGG